MQARPTLIVAAIASVFASTAAAQNLRVTVENLAPTGGVSLTPLWVGLDDGSFNVFDLGSLAPDNGIETVAEIGSTADITAAFTGDVQTTLVSPGGPPPFTPGEASASVTLDPSGARFLNFAAMLVPSNDLFVGTPAPIEVFDASGNYVGPNVIELTGADVWDAGTEVNDSSIGPAFVVGVDDSLGTVEANPVSLFFDDPDAATYVQSLIGLETPVGPVTTGFDSDDVLFRITLQNVPEPASAALLGLGALFLRRHR